MSEAVYRCLLNPMVTVFGEPKTDDLQAFLEEYASTLSQYDEDDLTEAKRHIMRTHKVRVWPTPAEMVKGCDEAMKRNAPTFKKRSILAIERCSTIEAVRALWKQRILPRAGYYSTMDAEAMCMRLGGPLEPEQPENVVSLAKRITGERE